MGNFNSDNKYWKKKWSPFLAPRLPKASLLQQVRSQWRRFGGLHPSCAWWRRACEGKANKSVKQTWEIPAESVWFLFFHLLKARELIATLRLISPWTTGVGCVFGHHSPVPSQNRNCIAHPRLPSVIAKEASSRWKIFWGFNDVFIRSYSSASQPISTAWRHHWVYEAMARLAIISFSSIGKASQAGGTPIAFALALALPLAFGAGGSLEDKVWGHM